MINLNAKLELSEARELLSKLKKDIREEENRLSEIKQRYYEKEYFSEEYYNEFFKRVKKIYHYLSKNNYPKDSVCSHHGISFNFRDDNITFTESNGNLQVVISIKSDKEYLENRLRVKFPLHSHKKRIELISEAIASNVLDKWNDDEGSTSFSVVFSEEAPESLLLAIKNYREKNYKDVSGFNSFREWINEANFDEQREFKDKNK